MCAFNLGHRVTGMRDEAPRASVVAVAEDTFVDKRGAAEGACRAEV
jgi:hypothetical protein